MRTLLLLALTLACHAAHAQAVYRCGPGGRSYSQVPCTDGRAVEVNDERSPQQRRDATEVAVRDRALADSLEQDRVMRDAQQPRAAAGKIDGRIGYARLANTEPAKGTVKKKKRSPKAAPHTERYKAPQPPAPKA